MRCGDRAIERKFAPFEPAASTLHPPQPRGLFRGATTLGAEAFVCGDSRIAVGRVQADLHLRAEEGIVKL